VVAAEAINNPQSYAAQLAPLPSTLFELVCLRIANDAKRGYHTLTQLQHVIPELAGLIPTVAWVNASQAAEKKVVEYTFVMPIHISVFSFFANFI
jgi:hypothetical protein